MCQGQVSELERMIEVQAETITRLEARIEEVACKCCAGDKGKGKQRVVVPDSPVLGSPIILAQSSDKEESLDSSYITPPLTTRSPSVTPLQLVDEEPMSLCVLPGSVGLQLMERRRITSRTILVCVWSTSLSHSWSS